MMGSAERESAMDITVNTSPSDPERRSRAYDGEVLILPASSSSLALVQHARQMIEEAFSNHDPRYEQLEVRATVDLVAVETAIYPRSSDEDAGPAAASGCRLRSPRHLPRRPSPSGRVSCQLPHGRHRLRAPSPPRYVVRGTAVPAQLVDAALRFRGNAGHGLSSALLGQAGQQQFRLVQLLSLERRWP